LERRRQERRISVRLGNKDRKGPIMVERFSEKRSRGEKKEKKGGTTAHSDLQKKKGGSNSTKKPAWCRRRWHDKKNKRKGGKKGLWKFCEGKRRAFIRKKK